MKIAIVGGGLAGLSAAYYIQKKHIAQIDIYEKDYATGGLAATVDICGTHIEKYYHHIFTHDKHYLELVSELDLENDLLWKKTKVGFFFNGVNYPLTTPKDILMFKPLSFINRIRFGLSSLFIARYKNLSLLENLTTEEFMLKFVGEKVWETIWKPMLKIKFGDNYNKIPAVWIWERIVQRFRSRTSGGKDEVLGYIKGSFDTLHKKLINKITDKGAKIHLNSDVTEIITDNLKCSGIVVNGRQMDYDCVICTAALPVYVDLLKNAPSTYIDPLKKVKYDCSLVVLMELKKSLSDIYWLNISDNSIPFGGLIEHTNFISKETYNNKTLVYFSKYLGVTDNLYSLSNEKIIELYITNLKKIFPEFDESIIEKYHVFRDRYAQPIWPMHYSLVKPQYKTPIQGLFLANTAQIYPNDRGMNFSVKLGKEVAEEIN